MNYLLSWWEKIFAEKIVRRMIQIFLLWLVIHFVVYNIVTFVIGIDTRWIKIIWAWKELILLYFIAFVIWSCWKIWTWKILWAHRWVKWWEIVYALLIVFTLGITLLYQGLNIAQYFLSFKYIFLWFFILFLFVHTSQFLNSTSIESLTRWYMKVIKRILWLALIWYIVIALKPGGLRYLGYDRNVVEGELGARPPAVYYTQLTYGYARNQFSFERPIHRWFFMNAFFPLFFMIFLRRKSIGKTWPWWLVWGINIVLTFSRASRGAWIIQLLVLGVMNTSKNVVSFLKKTLLPFIIILIPLTWFWREQIGGRSFSNTGHLNTVLQGLWKVWEKPLLGRGAWYVGPASFHGGIGFNPENQFLQVMIEYGSIAFILWLVIWIFLNGIGIWKWRNSDKKAQESELLLRLMALGIGMIGLSVSWMVLHSFVDRMIVYPLMAMYGLVLWSYLMKKNPG